MQNTELLLLNNMTMPVVLWMIEPASVHVNDESAVQ
jgi:hypothetical protein